MIFDGQDGHMDEEDMMMDWDQNMMMEWNQNTIPYLIIGIVIVVFLLIILLYYLNRTTPPPSKQGLNESSQLKNKPHVTDYYSFNFQNLHIFGTTILFTFNISYFNLRNKLYEFKKTNK